MAAVWADGRRTRVTRLTLYRETYPRQPVPASRQVNDDHLPVRISSKSGDVVLMSAEDFDSWQETIYLLRSPANARRLMEAVARDKSHLPAVVKTMEDLQALAGE
jgi:antitoxin YefM